MSFLSLRDIDELARLQGTILNRSALIDQLLEREKLQGKYDAPPRESWGDDDATRAGGTARRNQGGRQGDGGDCESR